MGKTRAAQAATKIHGQQRDPDPCERGHAAQRDHRIQAQTLQKRGEPGDQGRKVDVAQGQVPTRVEKVQFVRHVAIARAGQQPGQQLDRND